MNLYEINQEIEKAFDEAIDPETGELISEEAFEYLDQLEAERDMKIENIGCWIKNLAAEAKALKEEKQAFADRQRRAEKKAESLKTYLTGALNGEKFITDRVAISFRKSETVDVTDVDRLPLSLRRVETNIMPDKTGIKKAIKAGENIKGAVLIEKKNIQIK